MTEGVRVSAQPKDQFATSSTADGRVVHQALRRGVNERIISVNHDFHVAPPETMEVVCECVHPNCLAGIVMTVAEYDAVRRFPSRFFVKEGHEVAEGERVVTESAGYVVVENGRREGLHAVDADPRRRGSRSVGVAR
jgi:hypothetical protein